MRLPQMRSLVNTAIGIAFGGISCGMYLYYKQLETMNDSECFKEAVTILRRHGGAVSCLGEPIKHQGFKLGDTQYATEDAQFILKVKGPNDNGRMHLWAIPAESEYSIRRIELELDKYPNRRLLIKDGPTTYVKEEP